MGGNDFLRLLLLFLVVLSRADAALHPTDFAALQDFNNLVKKSMSGNGIPSWFPSVASPGDPCASYEGITCDSQTPSRVTVVNLFNLGLSASNILPLGNLKFITTIILSGNNFRGPIPPSFGSLTHLVSLNLAGNLFKGTVPSLPTSLQRLNLNQGRPGVLRGGLKGHFPGSLKALGNLTDLDLGSNSFSGPLPSWLGSSFPALSSLVLSYNRFTSSVPPLPRFLSSLSLSYNPFSPGPVPAQISNLIGLVGPLDLSSMNLQGPLTDLSRLATVTDLIMDFNKLSGPINTRFLPDGLLGFFSARSNRFTGPIPSDFLRVLSNPLYSMVDCGIILSDNLLTGTLPLALGHVIQVYVYDFSGNQLTGRIPPSYANRFLLTRLRLSRNRLSGPIPSSLWGNDLKELALDGNALTGTVPPQLGLSPELQLLDLSSNRLVGVVPPQVTALSFLATVDLSSNFFSGQLPVFPAASSVRLQGNYFNGVVPAGYTRAADLDVSGNCLQSTKCKGVAECVSKPQRAERLCKGFCGSDKSPPAPCGGHGYCYLGKGGAGTCRCDSGFNRTSTNSCKLMTGVSTVVSLNPNILKVLQYRERSGL